MSPEQLNAETQIATPENPPATTAGESNGESKESTPIKKQRGGWRPGAGRKKDVVKRLVGSLTPGTAAELLSQVDAPKVIREIFEKGSLTLKQRTLADLLDRAWGRPAQNVNVAGSVMHWTPDLLAHLSDEDVAVLARLTRKPAVALPESTESTNNQGGNQPKGQ